MPPDHDGGSAGAPALPRTILGYAWSTGGFHQLGLSALTVSVFLLDLAPLELQRRIVNGALRDHVWTPLAWLCALYLTINLTEGALKLALNVYRGWVTEIAARSMRRQVIGAAAVGQALDPDGEGAMIAIVVAEIDPVSGLVGSVLSEPLLQMGILVTVFGYLALLQPWIAVISVGLFALQLTFVPWLQHSINLRAAARVGVLRQVGGAIVDDPRLSVSRVDDDINHVMALNIAIYWRKYLMNFLMNALYHLSITGVFLLGGWLAISGRMEYGAIVAFVSGLNRINDPWGDLINYFRDLAAAQVKYKLIRDFLHPPADTRLAAAPR